MYRKTIRRYFALLFTFLLLSSSAYAVAEAFNGTVYLTDFNGSHDNNGNIIQDYNSAIEVPNNTKIQIRPSEDDWDKSVVMDVNAEGGFSAEIDKSQYQEPFPATMFISKNGEDNWGGYESGNPLIFDKKLSFSELESVYAVMPQYEEIFGLGFRTNNNIAKMEVDGGELKLTGYNESNNPDENIEEIDINSSAKEFNATLRFDATKNSNENGSANALNITMGTNRGDKYQDATIMIFSEGIHCSIWFDSNEERYEDFDMSDFNISFSHSYAIKLRDDNSTAFYIDGAEIFVSQPINGSITRVSNSLRLQGKGIINIENITYADIVEQNQNNNGDGDCNYSPINDDSGFSDQFPSDDIAWDGGDNSIEDIAQAFNHARGLDSTVSQDLVMPSQSEWDSMSIQQKALYLLNRERYDRGVKPFEGIDSNVIGVAQNYAELLYTNGVFGHTEDGSPWDRLDRVDEINNTKDFFQFAENLYVAGASNDYVKNPIAKAVYNWIYNDSGSSWGHRKFCLAKELVDNSGESGVEGLIGIGMKMGDNYQYSGFDGMKSTIVVMNAFDPASAWNHENTVQVSLCNGNNNGGGSNGDSGFQKELNDIKSRLDSAPDVSSDIRDNMNALIDEIEGLLNASPMDNDLIQQKLSELYDLEKSYGGDSGNSGEGGDSYNPFGSNASIITGSVTIPTGMTITPESDCYDNSPEHKPLASCNSISIDIFDENDNFINSTNVTPDGKYSIYLPEIVSGENFNATLKIHVRQDGIEENFYRDFGEDHVISSDDSFKDMREIEWVEDASTGNWHLAVNYIAISDKETTIDLPIADIDANKFILSGTVQVPTDFIPGDVMDSSGNWIGWNMVSLSAVNMSTGEYYWTEIGRQETSSENNHTYPFKLKLPKPASEYIISIEKSSNNEWLEMYLHDGGDHTFGDNDTLKSSMGVNWTENGGIWIPDTSKTGYFTVNDDVSNININIADFGANFKKIEGIVTPPVGFDLNSYNNDMWVSILDGETGNWLGDSMVNSDGTYSILLGEEINPNGYIIQIQQNHWDENDWMDSWWNTFYLDAGVIKDEMSITWGDNNGYWKPNVTPLIISDSAVVNIDFSSYVAPKSYTIEGKINGIPTNAEWVDIYLYNPVNYMGKGSQVESDGSFKITNLNEGKYILELNYYADDKYYHYTVFDDDGDFSSGTSGVDDSDILWIPYAEDGTSLESASFDFDFDWSTVGYWAPKSGTQKVILDVQSDIKIGEFAIVQPELFTLTTNLTGAGDSKSVDINLFVPNKPIGTWNMATSDSSGAVSTILDGVKERDDYMLSFWIDGLGEYWYNGTTLTSDVYWVGIQDGSICSDWQDETKDDTCDWNRMVDWEPNIAGFTINSDTVLNLAIPDDRATLTATLVLGADYANKFVDVYVSQYSGTGYAWESFLADNNGNVEVSMGVKQGSGYRMEVYSPDTWEGFVVDLGDDGVGGSNDLLITSQNSWDTSGDWGPKASTLIDISADVALGTLTPPSLNTITFSVTHLDANEEIYIDLEGINGWYSGSNVDWSDWMNPRYSSTVTIKVPSGDYKVMISAQNHQGGLINDDDDTGGEALTGTFSTFSWDWDKADKISLSGGESYTIELPSADTLKSITGTVSGITGGDMMGGIEVWSPTVGGNWAEVNSDGTFEIKGLIPADDYIIEYWSWLGDDMIQDIVGTFTDDKTINLEKASTTYTFSGTVTNNIGDSANISVLLIDVTDTDSSGAINSGDEWAVIDDIDAGTLANGGTYDYTFTTPPPLTGHAYAVAVGIKSVNPTTGATTFDIYESTIDGSTEVVIDTIDNGTDSVSLTVTKSN